MNLFKFFYDVFVWITKNYYQMPDSFKKSFPEEKLVDARLFLFEFIDDNSDINQNFKDYE